jgi:hypothetical protein
VFFGVEVGLDDVADEIAPCFGRYRFCGHYLVLFGISGPSAKFAPKSQAYFAPAETLVMRRWCYTPPLLMHMARPDND